MGKMRNLAQRQKKLLKEYFNNNKENIYGFNHVDDFPVDLWDCLIAINDTEVLYQNCNSYINDLLHGQFKYY